MDSQSSRADKQAAQPADSNSMSTNRPLCVDLDGTLIRTDSLVEAAVRDIRRNPLSSVRYPFWLMSGKAHLKKEISERAPIDARHLPYNETLLTRLKAEREKGRKLVLVTASDEAVATAVADHLDIFDEVYASDGSRNLSGARKRDVLVERFGVKGFDYVGDHTVDFPVWEAAEMAWVVNRSEAVTSQLKSRHENVEVVLQPTGSMIQALIAALRPHQWVKNLLIFLPLFLAHDIMNVDKLTLSLLKFASFCLCASGVYILNDIFDLDADRAHPRKRLRPFASGRLSILSGIFLFPLFFIAAYALAWFVATDFLAVLTIYVALTLLYSFRLKRVLMLDVVVLASLYTVRIFAGSTAIDVVLSPWLLGFSVFMFLSLAFAKRYSELYRLRLENKERAAGRGYMAQDVDAMLIFGAVSGFMSVLVFALYLNSEEVVTLYTKPQLLWLICPLLIYWIARFWLITHRGQMHEDPVVFALSDRTSFLTAALAVLIVFFAI